MSRDVHRPNSRAVLHFDAMRLHSSALGFRVSHHRVDSNSDAPIHEWLPSLALGAALGLAQFASAPPSDTSWGSSNALDGAARGKFRANSKTGREIASRTSDLLMLGLGAGLATDWYFLQKEYPLEMSIRNDGQIFLTNTLANRIAKVSAGRQRPFASECDGRLNRGGACHGGRDSNASFFSWHASTSATMAGLICARRLGRSQHSVKDRAICGGAVVSSLATGMLRVVADEHHLSDVVIGWAMGALWGFVVPRHTTYAVSSGAATTLLQHIYPVIEEDRFGVRYALVF